jgi:biopolymer transport protein ExbB
VNTELGWQTYDYLQQGGWIMVPLVVVSVVMWTMILDRVRLFRQYRRGDLDRAQMTEVMDRANDTLLSETEGQLGLRSTLMRNYLQERSGHADLDKEIAQQCAMKLRRGLDNRIAVIGVLAAIAPLLGLLGTVLGMIETFNVISVFGTGNARAMAGGISVAMITTQAGLLVAIPGLLMSNRLRRSSDQLKNIVDESAALLMRHITGGPKP